MGVLVGISERSVISRYLPRAAPPPLSGFAIAVDYANIALDPDVSLYERFCAVSTAVRLVSALSVELQVAQSPLALLERSGLCARLHELSNVEVCSGSRRNVFEGLVEIVNKCERGELVVTEDLVLSLAQSVIVLVVPALRLRVAEYLPTPRESDYY
jgi:hypothetical protein